MDRYEYIRIPFRWIPEEEIKQQYNLYALLVQANGFVYCKVCKGKYGLKQAATLLLMDTILFGKLQASGLKTLCVDDFGGKYTNLDDANHLLSTLKKHYRIFVDWEGEHYLGLTIKWDYAR